MNTEERNKYLGPPNPIISKEIQGSEKAAFTLKNQQQQRVIGPCTVQENLQDSSDLESEVDGRLTLMNGYSPKTLVYKKYENEYCMRRCNKSYFASIFTNSFDIKRNQLHSIGSSLQFYSHGESMNLFVAYQTGPFQYDLILQNDLNAAGYTQWYHFMVKNKDKNKTYKFNIVNLYKASSLYNYGMKPLVNSKKIDKGWRRTCSNVQYFKNQINVEHSRKFYSTLSFEYNFPFDNDQTLFAHCYPYAYGYDLKNRLKWLSLSKKVQIKTIGYSCLKKNIIMIRIGQEDKNLNKKAIIIMARQHPGETVGSLIMDQMMCDLTKITSQNEFLLWRFDIYCFPMVNVDGVIFGNYRGNAFGYDLNRCWDRDNVLRIPELHYIKKEIKKIQKKQPIEMILDLHGHSRKMGSFFYGNPFGRNTGVFALLASKQSSNISFLDSTFRKQTNEKMSAARVVLGNLIKQTGCFYTYETSFYGGWKNGKRVHFDLEDYKELGRCLNQALYKTFVEIYKEQKTLKQSVFLREIRKEVRESEKLLIALTESESDQEAKNQTKKQIVVKEKQIQQELPSQLAKAFSFKPDKKITDKSSIEIQVDPDEMIKSNIDLKRSRRSNEIISKPKYTFQLGVIEEQTQISKSNSLANPFERKNFLMKKLRIFGETFIEQNPKDTNKETQTNDEPLGIVGNSKLIAIHNDIQKTPIKSQYRKKKNRNRSLMIKLDHEQKLGMGDIVKVNRLEYKKIHRQSSHKKQQSKGSILPSLN